MPMIVSTHPRTRKQIGAIPLKVDDLVNLTMEQPQFVDPLPFFDFIALQKSAFCVLSDSGTVQEESCLLHVPSVTLRDHTERPETVECGASVLSGADPARIVKLVGQVTAQKPYWQVPPEYLRDKRRGYGGQNLDQPSLGRSAMKVLVVGGAGYVGGAVTDMFARTEHEVRVYDSLLYEDSYRKPVPFIRGDIRD